MIAGTVMIAVSSTFVQSTAASTLLDPFVGFTHSFYTFSSRDEGAIRPVNVERAVSFV